MGIPLSPITVTAGTQTNVRLTNPDFVQAVIISNKSVFDLQVSGMDLTGAQWQAAGVEDLYTIKSSNQGILSLQAFNTANISNPPTAVVLITIYLQDEKIPDGKWPATIPQQSVNVANNTTTSVTNDGNPAGTIFVEGTQQGSTGSNVKISNDGNMTLAEYVSSTLTNLLQVIAGTGLKLGNTSRLTEILGNLQVDGNTTHTGSTTMTGAVTATNSGNNINATQLNGIFQGGDDATNVVSQLLTASGRGFAVTTNDGTTNHEVLILDKNGNVLINIPGAKVTGTVANATSANNANLLNEGINIAGGLGRTAADDILTLSTTDATYGTGGLGTNVNVILKSIGNGKSKLNAGGIDNVIADGNNGVYINNGLIGRTAKADMIDGSGTPLYFKSPSGGSLIYQSPSGTTQWQRAKENHGTIVAVANGTVTVTHGMGRVPDMILVTPNNGTAGSQTFAVWNVTTTTFQIFNAANTPTYWWKCENYT